jgi:hypothetical protein
LSLSTRPTELDPEATLIDAGGRAVPMSMHASIGPDMARWLQAVAASDDGGDGGDGGGEGGGDEQQAEWRTLADLMHSLDLSVLSRLAIGRHIRTEYMLPPEEVGQRFAGRLTRLRNGESGVTVVGGNDQLATGPRLAG